MTRARGAAVAVLAISCLVMVLGLGRTRLDTGVDTVVPQQSGSFQALQRAQQAFGGDPVIVLLKSQRPGQLLGPDLLPRLLQTEGKLARLSDVAVVYGPATVLNQVAAGAQELLATISGRRDALHDTAAAAAKAGGASPAAAERAGQAAETDFDRRYGALLAQGLPAGLPTLRNATFVHTVAFDAQDRPRAQYKFVIPDASSVVILIRPREALSNEGVERLVTRIRRTVLEAHLAKVAVTITGGPALAAGLAGTVRSELPRLAILATGVVGILFLLTGSGPRGRRLVPLVCALIATGVTLSLFGLTGHPIALGMLALLPVLLGVGSDFPVYLARASSRRTVIVAGLASSASCASLWLSPVPFVRGLGVALALGILCSLTLGLCLMKRCDNHDARPRLAGRTTKPLPRRRAMIAAASLAALFGWLALPGLTVESDPDKVAQGVPALAQVKIAEQALGTSGEMDVVLRGPDVLSPTALAWQNRALAAIVTTYGDQVRLVASPATFLTFLGDHPTAAQITAGADLLPAYLLGAVVTPDRSQALTSYGVQLTDVAHQGKIFRDIQHVLPAPPSGYTTAITGLPVLAAQGYESLSANRFVSNLLGLALAGGVLLVGLPHRKDGLRALLASGLAIGWGLLILKVAGVPLTPLTTSLGSLTAAVGCEFVAVAAVARRQGNGLGERGVALAASSSTLGYLVLVASGLAIMRSFGLVLASSMVLAYAATQFVLRAFPVVDVMDQEPQAHRVDLVMETVV